MNKTDRETLAEFKQDLCWIKKMLENHLKHHWAVTLSLLGITFSSILTLLIFLITK